MLKPEFDDHAEEAGLAELIELFERFVETKEQHFFDEESLERILEFYEMRNDFEKMENVADYAIEQNPYSSEFLIRKAELQLHKKDYSSCLEWLDKAIILDSHDIDIYLIKSDVFIETNQIDRAHAVLENALEMVDEDEHDVLYAQLSDIYEMKEDFESAFEALSKALEINPHSEEALHKTAHIVEMTDKYEESIRMHRSILDKDPYSYLAWYNLGRAYTGMGLYEKALESFEFVHAINEDYDLAYREAADVLYRQEAFDKAIQYFEIAQVKGGGYEDYSFRIGLCHERNDAFKQARFHYRKAVRLDPFLDEAYFRIGETYRVENRYEAALVNYKKALKIDEENEFYLSAIIRLYDSLGRINDALTFRRRLVNSRSDVPNYWIELVQILYEEGEYQEGLDTVNDALHRCGTFAEFYYLESVLLWKTGKQKESIAMLEHALSTDFKRHMILAEMDTAFYNSARVMELIETYRP